MCVYIYIFNIRGQQEPGLIEEEVSYTGKVEVKAGEVGVPPCVWTLTIMLKRLNFIR